MTSVTPVQTDADLLAPDALDYLGQVVTDVLMLQDLPFADELRQATGLGTIEVMTGVLAIGHSVTNARYLLSCRRQGHLPPRLVVVTLVAVTTKIVVYVVTGQVFPLITAVFDGAVLVWALLPAWSLGRSYFTTESAVSALPAASETKAGRAAHARPAAPAKRRWRLWARKKPVEATKGRAGFLPDFLLEAYAA
jgi:hypothetical protein